MVQRRWLWSPWIQDGIAMVQTRWRWSLQTACWREAPTEAPTPDPRQRAPGWIPPCAALPEIPGIFAPRQVTQHFPWPVKRLTHSCPARLLGVRFHLATPARRMTLLRSASLPQRARRMHIPPHAVPSDPGGWAVGAPLIVPYMVHDIILTCQKHVVSDLPKASIAPN
jgi:hypothetical protein